MKKILVEKNLRFAFWLGVSFGIAPLHAVAQTTDPHAAHAMPGMQQPAPRTKAAPPRQERKAEKKTPSGGQAKAPAVSHENMDHGSMNHENMDHGNMDHGSMDHSVPDASATQHGKEWAVSKRPPPSDSAMEMGPMQGGSPPPDARDPDAYAEGEQKHSMPGMDMADNDLYGRVMLNELEYADGRRDQGQGLDLEAWYGGDYHKVWLKLEGERRNSTLESSHTELLWDRVFSTFWSTQLGLRHDTGGGPSRNWLAIGVQGLAPYWFETSATAYVSDGSRLAARTEIRYDLLLTQRLILEPKLEANLYSKGDPERGIGSGLSDLSLGLRLRYEIRRQLAPYIGVSWNRKFGGTADFARSEGDPVRDTELVAGLRVWF